MKLSIQETARILHNDINECWEVHLGITIPYRGSMMGCERWCELRGITVKNRAEINRVKYKNMPIQEMFGGSK